MANASKTYVEHELPFVRLLRWNGEPIDDMPNTLATDKPHTFVVSVGPPLSQVAKPLAVRVKLNAGTIVDIQMSKVGAASGSGHLWQGTIAAGTLDGETDYLLRVSAHAGSAACELDFRTKRYAAEKKSKK